MLRKLVFTTVFAAVLAATSFTVGCKPGDPNAFETHIEKLSDPKTQTEAMQGIERIVSGIAANDDATRRKEFAEKVLPKFEEIWADSPQFREQMLAMATQMKQPEAVGIWTKALELDGSAEGHKQAIMALEGIRAANASAAAKPVIDALTKLKDSPNKDNAEGQPGALRYEMCKTLGDLHAKEAAPLLIELLKQPEEQQPKAIYKAAAHALGQIGDASAVSELIAVQFRVADVASTTSIPEMAIQAIGAIGEAAVPKLVETIEGKNTEVNELAAEKGVEVTVVQQTALRILGVVGSSKGTSAMVAYMPQADCAVEPPPAPEDMQDDVSVRAFAANSLGFVGDPAAVKALCSCRNTTHNPGDLWEIVSALGRIGGDEAFECLKDIATNNFYNPDELPSSDFKYQIRWEGVRWMIIAAPPAKAADIKTVVDANDAKVKEEVEKLGWMKGAAVLDECKEDKACYEKVLADSTRDWFEREVAAFNYARMSEPGDIAAAANLAKAFKTRDPEARINIAWLSAKVAAGKPCPECAKALEDVMKAEELTKEPTMQGAWLTARQTIAKVTAGAPAAAATEAK
ncbi:HEAT repeat domain-containing protein [Nannocystaceae bacterium ST9]